MPDKKQYIISLPGFEEPGRWDVQTYEKAKHDLFKKYPDAQVFEFDAYNDKEDPEEQDMFHVQIDGLEGEGMWDAKTFAENKDNLFKKYPNAKVYRSRGVDYWYNTALEDEETLKTMQTEIDSLKTEFANTQEWSPEAKALQAQINDKQSARDALQARYNANPRVIEANKRYQEEMEAAQAEYEANLPKELRSQIAAAQNRMYKESKWIQGHYDYEGYLVPGANPSVPEHLKPLLGEDGKGLPSEPDELKERARRTPPPPMPMREKRDNTRVDVETMSRGGSGNRGETVANYNAAAEFLDSYDYLVENRSSVAQGAWYNMVTSPSDEAIEQVSNVLKKLESACGNLNEVTPEDIEKALTSSEQTMLQSYFLLKETEEKTSSAFKGGEIAGEGFKIAGEMIVFDVALNMLLPGAGTAAGAASKLSKARKIASAVSGWFSGGSKVKKLASGALKASKFVAKQGVKAATFTALAPTTYSHIAEKKLQIDENGRLKDSDEDIMQYAAEELVENFTEFSGEGVAKLVGKAGKWAKGTKLGGKIAARMGNSWFGKAGQWLLSTKGAKYLEKAGFQGLPIEVFEEFEGAVINQFTGLNENAIEEFADKDNLTTMLIGFAPMTLLGAGTGMGTYAYASNSVRRDASKLKKILLAEGFSEGQADYLINYERQLTPESLGKELHNVMLSMSQNGASSKSLKAVTNYAKSVGRYKAMDGILKTKDSELRKRKQAELDAKYGTHIGYRQSDSQSDESVVTTATLLTRQKVYITSEKNEAGEYLAIDMESGESMPITDEDIGVITDENGNESAAVNTRSYETYLAELVMADRKQKEQQRMQQETVSQISALQEQLKADPKLNIGTSDAPVIAVFQSGNAQGAEFVLEDGTTKVLTWNEVGDYLGQPIRVLSDAEIAEAEAAALEAEEAKRRAENAKTNEDMDKVDELVEDAETTEEVVAPTNIPMNPDGTVNTDLFWDQNPEEWVKWNDQQKQDGGVDSMAQVAAGLQTAEAKLAEASKMPFGTPTQREARDQEMGFWQDKISRYNAILEQYQMAEEIEESEDYAVADAQQELAQQQSAAQQILRDLYSDESLSEEEIELYINANVEGSQKDLDKHLAKAPKMGRDMAKYKQEKAAFDAKTADLEAERDLWREVAAYVSDPQVEMDMEPQNALELAAYELSLKDGGIKILPESFRRHTGYGKSEQVGFLSIIRTKQKGGISMEAAGERLMEIDRENATGFFDQSDPNAGLNTLLELLSSVKSSSEIRNYILGAREELAQQQTEAVKGAIIEQITQEQEDAQPILEESEVEGDMPMTPQEASAVLDAMLMSGAKRTDGAVVAAMQDFADAIAVGVPAKVVTRKNVIQTLKEAGVSERKIAEVKDALRRIQYIVNGFEANGVAYILADDVITSDDIRGTYVHERQHIMTAQSGLDAALMTMTSREELQSAIAKLTNSNFYNGKGHMILADELISMAMERAYKGENLDEVFERIGLKNENAINFIKSYDNAQRNDSGLSLARVAEIGGNTAEGGSGQDGRAEISGSTEVGEQGTRPSGRGGEATGDNSSRRGVGFSVTQSIERINNQFNAELQQQIDGTLPVGHVYQLGMPSRILRSTGIADAPIQLNSTRLEDKAKNFGHDFDLSEIKDLVNALQSPMGIFAYGDKSKAQNIVVEIQHNGRNFIVGLAIKPTVNGRVLDVNSIRNVFPKDNAEWLNWISQNKALYLDKEKIQGLIGQQRTNLADVEYLDLDSIAKIVENFENPSSEDARFSVITPQMDADYLAAVERGDMETAQRMVDDVAKAAGYTIRGDHGRVSKFTIFDRNKANPEGNWGQGFYFSNNEEDVENNYATVDSPDLETKIDREVERRANLAEMNEDFNEDEEVDEFAIREAVEKEFITSEPNVVHAAIRMNNPFVVGHGMVEVGEDGLGHYDMRETYLTAEYETDEDGEIDFDVEPTGTLVDLVDALNDELAAYEWVNVNADEILLNNIDGMTASQFEQEARELLSPYIDSLANDNTEIMSSEIIRAAIERAGFDGIVDNTINQKFGSARRFGRAMEGVDRDTRHYIAFQSNQIKQTDAVTYDDAGNVIPLSERFNPDNEDIRFSASGPITYDNFYKETAGVWEIINPSEVPSREADYTSTRFMRPDLVSSRYWYGSDEKGDYVIRESDHWSASLHGENSINDFMADPSSRKYTPISSARWAIDMRNATEEGTYNKVKPEFFKDGKAYGKIYLSDLRRMENIRFSIANENQAIFVSNAARAVDAIKMEKATPEQWLKMIEKNGGLKAGEDKWMGLSDWLKESDRKTLTKAEVLDFINENMIVIEEQHYTENAEDDAENTHAMIERILQEKFGNYIAEYYEQNNGEDDNLYRGDSYEYAMDKLREEMNDEFPYTIERSNSVVYLTFPYEETDDLQEWADKLGVKFAPQNPINNTRLDYTTNGLQNNHEIALVVPAIEPWNESDEVHFGDAGEGRAVVWVRFGDTQIVEEGSYMEYEPKNDVEREIKDYIEYAMRNGDDFNTSVGYAYNQITDAPQESVGWTKDAVTAVADGMRGKEKTRKVLVIDEIQSKRHQEGREKGYTTKEDVAQRKAAIARAKKATNDLYDYIGELVAKYPGTEYSLERVRENRGRFTEEENNKLTLLIMEHNYAELELEKHRDEGIPDAPFEKNWHELAMKRMLRYAAENGYDVIAWTKGEQQAERYNLGKFYSGIERQDNPAMEGRRFVLYGGNMDSFMVNDEGVVIESTINEAINRPLSDIVGKELAVKMMQMDDNDMLDDADITIGGEGMKGFYDRMLPAFMNKYGKKWGVKVEDIHLNLEGGLTMHSVPVTEEMKSSVMEGQVMFSVRNTPISPEVRAEMDVIAATAMVNGNYMLAPNGQPTKLTEDQWAMVRTKAFKTWFGDWELPYKMIDIVRGTMNHGFANFDDARQWAKDNIVRVYGNEETGGKGNIEISNNAVKKYLSGSAVKKSDSKDLHLAVMKVLPSVIRNGVIAETHADYMKDERGERTAESRINPDVTIHRVYGAVRIGDDIYRVKVTLKEHKDANRANTPHSYEATKIELLAGTLVGAKGSNPNTNNSISAANLLKGVEKSYESGKYLLDDYSKVVDENGEPMVVYHGTQSKFTAFDVGYKGKNFGFRLSDGFYFSPDETVAESYASFPDELKTGEVKAVFLNIINPFHIKSAKDYREQITEIVSLAARGNRYQADLVAGMSESELLSQRGYDGVVEKRTDGVTGEIVVFEPSQIKSATDNTGEFSESEDIRFSSRFDVNTNPTEAQKKAGNYKMGHLRLDGYNITIENPKGSIRRGTDSKGNAWENTLNNDYGYIRGTEGVDGDHIDVYLSDNPAEGNVFVIDQVNPETREFDEHKVMYGFSSMDEAREAYLANFSKGWNGLGTITEVTKDEFRKWIDSSHRKTKPFSEYKSVKTAILDEGDIRFSVSERPVDEIVNEGVQKVSEEGKKAKTSLKQRMDDIDSKLYYVMRMVAAAQKNYDKKTVDIMTNLAKDLMRDGALSDPTRGEINRLLAAIKNATGKADLTKSATALLDVMVSNQLRHSKDMFKHMLSIKTTKVNTSGVEVQGRLDLVGQRLLSTIKGAIGLNPEEADGLNPEQIEDRIAEVKEKLDKDSDVEVKNAQIDLAALNLAKQYVEGVVASKAEEKNLRHELKTAEESKKNGEMTAEGLREFRKATEDAIRQNLLERTTSYRSLLSEMARMIAESFTRAGNFRDAEKERVERIHHFANSDMQGLPAIALKEKTSVFWNSPFTRVFLAPFSSFEQWMKRLGSKNAEGKGYLYNHFIPAWINAANNEYLGVREAYDVLDAKAREVFGKGVKRWSDLFSKEKKMATMTVKIWDDGEMRDYELSQGNLLYIYMVNKMTDGKMKLRRMGITEEDVRQIYNNLDPRFIEIAEWIQNDFLPSLRDKYNAVHEKMFGAPMAAIENYFPIRVHANARTQNEDLGNNNTGSNPATITGSIIKRTKNSLALDVLGSDAFDVVLEHIQQMEHWAAFAEFNKDLNTLLSYKKFRNRVQNMSGIYGTGKDAWKNFRETAEMVAGVYRPKASNMDSWISKIIRGLTSGKIGFRLHTAMKQFLSAPAFLPYSAPHTLVKNMARPINSWKWAMKNLPGMKKRWGERDMGNIRLKKVAEGIDRWTNNWMDICTRLGMTPNAFVDALTCSIGAKSVYETTYAKYKKDGYSHEDADRKAKIDATIVFNATQQSSESAFLSTLQADRDMVAYMTTTYRNANFGMQRELIDALRNMKHRMTPGYKEESIEFMTKQMIRDGVSEENARRAAERVYRTSAFKDSARIATFGFLMQFLWNMGGSIIYLFFGDDDEEKQKIIEDAAFRGMFGSVENLTFGNLVVDGIMLAREGEFEKFNPHLSPAGQDLARLYEVFSSDLVGGASDLINIISQIFTGANLQVAADAAIAIYDACDGDLELSKEVGIALLRIIQAPQSQVDKLIEDEIDFTKDKGLDMTIEEFARNYASYKKRRNAPYTFFFYDDEQERKVEDKYIKRFTKRAEELKRTRGSETAKAWYDYVDNEYKEVSKTISELRRNIVKARKRGDEVGAYEFAEALRDFMETPEAKRYRKRAGRVKLEEKLRNEMKDRPQRRDELEDRLLSVRRQLVEEMQSEE